MPFFLYHLKGRGDGKFPQAYVFQTGMNQWRNFDRWPPAEAKPTAISWTRKGKLAWQQPRARAASTSTSPIPNKPVPYIGSLIARVC